MIKFESEKAFEEMLFDHIRMSKEDPIYGGEVLYGQRQPEFGANGIGDILLITESKLLKKEKKHRVIHLIELKIQPIISSHIAQICKYRRYLENMDFSERLQADEYKYTLINPFSEISTELLCLAACSEIDLRYYEMSMSGINFLEYEDDDIFEQKNVDSADLLSERITKGIE